MTEPMNASDRPVLPRGPYLLCDDTVRPELPLEEKAARLLAGGARILQLRMKRTSLREALAAAREVVAACRRAGAVCLLNDRVDLALLAGADGVHVGDEDLPPEAKENLSDMRQQCENTAKAGNVPYSIYAECIGYGIGCDMETGHVVVIEPCFAILGAD